MRFSLIVCTYQRPVSLLRLLKSVQKQSLLPQEIIIVDASEGNLTSEEINRLDLNYLRYFKVTLENKGLTRQRNYGIAKVSATSEIICFLDDDIVLTENYFENLTFTYNVYPDAVGVGGYIIDKTEWKKLPGPVLKNEFQIDGWVRKLGSRYWLRKELGLTSKMPPGYMPEFSHGFPIAFLPPSGEIYQVEFFMGGVSSFRKNLFKQIKFSTYFEGYGLYEDMDFCLKASKIGKLFVNTNALLHHLHDFSGRPNYYKYGKMVVRNGWYVWREKYPKPSFKSRTKWHLISLYLILVRLTNIINTAHKKEAMTESVGRIAGWCSLFFNKPS